MSSANFLSPMQHAGPGASLASDSLVLCFFNSPTQDWRKLFAWWSVGIGMDDEYFRTKDQVFLVSDYVVVNL